MMLETGGPPKRPGDRRRPPRDPGDKDLQQRLGELERALTEKQWSETALREKEARLRLVVEQMPAVIWSTDADLRFTSVMGAGLAALNLKPNQAVGVSLFEYFRTNDPAFMPIAAHRLALHGESLAFEMEWMGRVLQNYVEPLRDRDGGVIGTVGVALDITPRKRAEEAVREREERLRLIAEQMPAVVWSIDADLRFTSSLGAGLAALNLKPNQVVGMSLYEYYRTSDLEFPAIAAHRQALRGEEVAYELEWAGRIFQNYVEPLRDGSGAVIGAIGVAMDVTERKRAEETVKESEERYRTLVQTSPDAITLTDLEGRVLLCNEQAARMHGVGRPEELVGMRAAEFIVPEERERAAENVQRVLREGEARNLRYTMLRRDGSRFPAELSASLIRDARGEPAALVGVVRDVTERKKAEETRSHLAAIVESSEDAIYTKALDGTLTSWNKAAEAIFGYDAEEVVGRNPPLFIPPDRAGEMEFILERVGREERIEHFETVRVRKDGTRVEVSLSVSPVYDDAGNVIAASVIARDVTERKRREEWSRFLDEATLALASSLDTRETLGNVARLCVPRLADWCAVQIRDRPPEETIVVHTDPAKVQLARDLQRKYPPDPDAPRGVYHVMRTGKPDLMPVIPEQLLEESAQGDPERLRLYRELGLKSAMVVPLLVRGQAVGAITFVTSESGHHYDLADLAHARELARRGALAIENAGLYTQAQAELAERKRAEERFRTVIESAPSALLMTDAKGTITLLNAQAEKLFGYRREELIGQPVERLIPARFAGAHPGHREGFFAGPQARPMGAGRDLYGLRKDGTEVPVEIGLNPIRTPEGVMVIVDIVDITQRKRKERLASELKAWLEERE